MAQVTKSTGGGQWLDKKSLTTGDKLKITTEAEEQPNQQGGTQLVAKCNVQGKATNQNFSINAPSKNALIEAYGDDTLNWIDKVVTVNVMNTVVAGKMGVAMYLVPDGFEVKPDSEGFVKVMKSTDGVDAPALNADEPMSDEISPSDIPF